MGGKWIGLAGLMALLSMGCTHEVALEDMRQEVDNQDQVIENLKKRNAALSSRLRLLEAKADAREAELVALRGERDRSGEIDAVGARMRELEESFAKRLEGLSSGLDDQDVRVRNTSEGLAFEVASQLLFASGQAKLKPAGEKILLKIAPKLIAYDGKIRVDGHTDNEPVRHSAKRFPKGNLQLSIERALEVGVFLTERAHVPAEKLAIAGFSQNRPLESNDTPAGRARNRRVDIVLLGAK